MNRILFFLNLFGLLFSLDISFFIVFLVYVGFRIIFVVVLIFIMNFIEEIEMIKFRAFYSKFIVFYNYILYVYVFML